MNPRKHDFMEPPGLLRQARGHPIWGTFEFGAIVNALLAYSDLALQAKRWIGGTSLGHTPPLGLVCAFLHLAERRHREQAPERIFPSQELRPYDVFTIRGLPLPGCAVSDVRPFMI